MANDIKSMINDAYETGIKKAKGTTSDIVNSTAKKATGTTKDYVKNITSEVNSINIGDMIKQSFKTTDVAYMVNDLVDKSIEEMVADEVRKARTKFDTSDIGSALNTAESYYRQILNSDFIMKNIRDDWTKSLTKSINTKINSQLYQLQKSIGGDIGRKLLAKSKISSILTKAISTEVTSAINAIVSNKAIATVSQDIINTVTTMQKKMQDQINTQFKNEIAYYKKIEKAVQDKIDLFNKEKAKYEERLKNEVTKLQNAINAEVKKIEQAVVNEISKVVKIDSGSLGGLF